jgi:acetyltransferase-like isoleucine patch superfamily enzyme
MDRVELLANKPEELNLYQTIMRLHHTIRQGFQEQFKRSLPFPDELLDRWERAKFYGFGENSSVYDSCYIFGDVQVGCHTWIGQFTILDGSGILKIGNYCTISAGVHIYTHDNIKNTLSGGKLPLEKKSVIIEDCCYIAPHCVISKGVSIGKHSLIAANSFVKNSIEPFSVAAGNPAKVIGRVVIDNDTNIELKYF